MYAFFWAQGYRNTVQAFFDAAKHASDPAYAYANGQALYAQRAQKKLPKLDLSRAHHRAFWIKYGDVLSFPIVPRHVDLTKPGEAAWKSESFQNDESPFYQKFFVRLAAQEIHQPEVAHIQAILEGNEGREGGPTFSRSRKLYLLRTHTREHFDAQLKRTEHKGLTAVDRLKEKFAHAVGISRLIKNTWAQKPERSAEDASHNDKVAFRRSVGAVRAIGKLRLFEAMDATGRNPRYFLVNFDFSNDAIFTVIDDREGLALQRKNLDPADQFERRRHLLAKIRPQVQAYREKYGQDGGKQLDWDGLKTNYLKYREIVELAEAAEYTKDSMKAERLWDEIVERVRALRKDSAYPRQQAKDWVWSTVLPAISELDAMLER